METVCTCEECSREFTGEEGDSICPRCVDDRLEDEKWQAASFARKERMENES